MDNLETETHGGVVPDTMSGAVPAPAAPPAKRGPGKPKGSPKSGGRKKGTPNRSTVQTRDRIRELADPIKFMSDVMAGKRLVAAGEPGDMKKTWCYPTLEQRLRAGDTLLRKLLPDLKATELSGSDGGPIGIETAEKPVNDKETVRRIALILTDSDDAVAKAVIAGLNGERAPSDAASAKLDGDDWSGSSVQSAKGGRGPLSDSRRDGTLAGTQTSTRISEKNSPKNSSENSSEKISEKIPAPGETADVGGYLIRCDGPSRPNLPCTYAILTENGSLLRNSVGDWPATLKWIEAKGGCTDEIEILPPSRRDDPPQRDAFVLRENRPAVHLTRPRG